MSIQVNDFIWKPGENDAEYIRLLKRSNEECHKLLLKATGKLVKMAHAGTVEWISVKDRLPDVGADVFLYSPVEGMEIGSLEKYDYTDSGYAYFVNKNGFNDIERYLYWMPLPRPPKEG